MTSATTRPTYGADSHIMEVPRGIERHADPDILPQLLPLNLDKAGTATFKRIEARGRSSE